MNPGILKHPDENQLYIVMLCIKNNFKKIMNLKKGVGLISAIKSKETLKIKIMHFPAVANLSNT